MCGIVGFTTFFKTRGEKDNSKQYIEKMCEKIKKRGPDTFGYYIKNDFLLGHRRLSIIDIETGAQPMTSDDGNYTIVYNGEIYNSNDLKTDLLKKGYKFKTTSDTEVLLYTYIEYKEETPKLLNGIFAFAIVDIKKNNLFLCRDHFGVKPLYYTIVGKNIVFASEIKGIFAHPEVKAVINDNSLREIFGMFPSRTEKNGIFENIYEIGYGEYANFSLNGLSTYKYYELEARENLLSYDECKNITKDIVTDSVLRQMVSDVPIGTFLSGGVDSSIITAIASNELKKRNRKLSTISFDYKDNSLFFKSNAFQVDEDKEWVKKMVQIFDTDHKYLFLDTKDLIDGLYDGVLAKDYPGMADIDSSLLRFCKDVKKSHSVVLSGECAEF
ncbi:MAG: asparagine synthase (glutamine-hydrolyzing) [Lachnospirales bacterium]